MKDGWEQARKRLGATSPSDRQEARSAARRHPATTATWAWLEEGEGRERPPEEREYLADKIAEIDRLLFELDEGSAYVV